MESQIILLWGAPAAGKTAVARALVEGWQARGGRRLFHLASDRISRAVVGPTYVAELRPAVYRGMAAMADELLQAGLDVILDANYLQPQQRREILAMALTRGRHLASVHVTCGLASRLARNRARAATEQVPEHRVAELHALAESSAHEADLLVDTDLDSLEEAAERVFRWMSSRQR